MISVFRRTAVLLVCVLISSFAANAPAAAAPAARFAAIAVEAGGGRVLYERHADEPRYPASLSKVMTLYLAFDALESGRLNMNDRVVISPHAAAQPPTRLGLAAGRSLTVREALDVIVVKSANDVAVALAERIAGSEAAFVARMNAKTRRLGMNDTHFANASGLPDPRNLSTARDLARLADALIDKHTDRYAIFDRQQTAFRGRVIPGHNRLLRRADVDGIKTGYTRASGFNLISSGVRDGRRVIAVVLGGRTAQSRDNFMAELLETSFKSISDPDRRVAATRPAAQAVAADAAAGRVSSVSYWVQVGVFSDEARGWAWLELISDRYPRRLRGAAQRLSQAGRRYSAGFVLGSRGAADDLCALLKAEGQDCFWVRQREALPVVAATDEQSGVQRLS